MSISCLFVCSFFCRPHSIAAVPGLRVRKWIQSIHLILILICDALWLLKLLQRPIFKGFLFFPSHVFIHSDFFKNFWISCIVLIVIEGARSLRSGMRQSNDFLEEGVKDIKNKLAPKKERTGPPFCFHYSTIRHFYNNNLSEGQKNEFLRGCVFLQRFYWNDSTQSGAIFVRDETFFFAPFTSQNEPTHFHARLFRAWFQNKQKVTKGNKDTFLTTLIPNIHLLIFCLVVYLYF